MQFKAENFSLKTLHCFLNSRHQTSGNKKIPSTICVVKRRGLQQTQVKTYFKNSMNVIVHLLKPESVLMMELCGQQPHIK
mmetsp:Transcript_66102/g.123685  ORF Transcript_66102/g.123685 Transcript_66102/m.123685 type:complete len:80 (-) Transcript_66102:768-1007(-)